MTLLKSPWKNTCNKATYMHILCIIDVHSKCKTMQLFSYIHTYITIDSSYINKTKSTTQLRTESQYHHKNSLKNKIKARTVLMF